MEAGNLKRSIAIIFALQSIAVVLSVAIGGFDFTAPAEYTITSETLWNVVEIPPTTIHLPVIFILFVGVILAPLIEEIAFRGPIWFWTKFKFFNNFVAKSKIAFWGIALGGGILFGFQHVNYSLVWQFTTSFIGLTFSWLVLKYRKLWPTILLHYLWNIIFANIEFFFNLSLQMELIKLGVFP